MQPTDLQALCPGCMQPRANPAAPCPRCGYAGQPNLPHQLAVGSVLDGRYLIGRSLGQGGFGITYVAMDLNLQTRVAIKEYYPEGIVSRDGTGRGTVYAHTGQGESIYAQGRERFLQEARVLAQFQYLPGVVTVRDYFNANHTAYIVMEYVEGITLKQTIAAAPGGKLPAGPLLAQLEPLMESLEIIHSTGLLHRDISPDNIMVRPDGGLVLLDFGAARQFSVEGEHSNTVNVKHGYAPPEQYRSRGNQGPWTDVYALCATIYKATTGQTPPQSVDRMSGDALPPPRALGADLTPGQEAAVLQGMALAVPERIPSVKTLRQALEAKGAQPKRPEKAQRSTPEKKPGKKAWLAVGAGVVVCLIVVGVLTAKPHGAREAAQALAAIPESTPEPIAIMPEPLPTANPKNFILEETGRGVAITGYTGNATDLRIPDTIGGTPVTEIRYGAFQDCTSLTSVTIPNSVTTIGKRAFFRCTSLTNIKLPDSVTAIEEGTFRGCISLTGVTIPNSIIDIRDGAFSGCTSLASVTIPEGVMTMGKDVFSKCTSLTSVTIPDSVMAIGEYAFLRCDSLTIHAPANSYAQRYAEEKRIPCQTY